MTDLPQIINPDPIIIPGKPATPEIPAKQFNELYVTGLLLTTDTITNQNLMILLCPYDNMSQTAPTNWRLMSNQTRLVISDIWAEAKRNSSFASAIESVLHACNYLIKERTLKSQITNANAADESDLQTQLSVLHQQMGVTE